MISRDMNEYTESLEAPEGEVVLKPKRGRPEFVVQWPEAEFTAEEIHESLDRKLSRVSVHAKINKAVLRGELKTVGKIKPRTGRPKTVYKRTSE